jgi:hypothetical protein
MLLSWVQQIPKPHGFRSPLKVLAQNTNTAKYEIGFSVNKEYVPSRPYPAHKATSEYVYFVLRIYAQAKWVH